MRFRPLLVSFALGACLGVAPPPPAPLATQLLDRYAAGRFDEVVAELGTLADLSDLLRQFRRDAPAWIDAGGAAARDRRTLAAVTVALEAARAGAWIEWKWIQRQEPMCAGGECYYPPNILYWQPPPLLIEWGCERLRTGGEPSRAERWWHLAALAVAQRSEDAQFLIGDTKRGLGWDAGEIGNERDEIKHLEHARARFPKDARFVLAEGIARDRDLPDDAFQAYSALAGDPDVGGEAAMRLGAMQMRRGRVDEALDNFDRATALTRDPYVLFLAHYFTGQAMERAGRAADAERAYRRAVAHVPRAQSATLALATLIFRRGQRAEAQRLVAALFAPEPQPPDPWRTFVHADDRFWPALVGRLRGEILK
jgi:tetratricopeptide (TPR) repeat protein